MEVLIDELLEEEVQELNKIEEMKVVAVHKGYNKKRENLQASSSGNLANNSLHGKFHDYKTVDMRDIMNIFSDY